MSREASVSCTKRHNPFHNPLPASLSSEFKKAARILESFIKPQFFSFDVGISQKVLARAKALVIFTSLKAGFMGSIRFGSGLIVARLPDGSWSAPSAMATGGLGFGGQFGIELVDFIFVLNTDEAVRTFTQSGSITLGGNISLALGPFGRNAEAGGALGKKGMAGMYAYSKTRGLFGGLTIESGILGERPDANAKMYNRKVSTEQLLRGDIPPPPEAEPLMAVLGWDVFQADANADAGDLPAELPSREIHEDSAELPAQRPDEPVQGIPELPAESQTAELSTGTGNEVVEAPSENQNQGSASKASRRSIRRLWRKTSVAEDGNRA